MEYEKMELPATQFQIEKLIKMYMTIKRYDDVNGTRIKNVDYSSCIGYMKQYIYPIEKGEYMFYKSFEKEFIHYVKSEIQGEIYKHLEKDLINSFEKDYLTIFKITSSCVRPDLFKENDNYFLNLSKPIKWLYNPMKYNDFSDDLKQKTKEFLNFVKEFIGDSYEPFLKWIKNICLGKKNDVLILLNGIRRIGKSTLIMMFFKYVFGEEICLEGDSDLIISKFNMSMRGKLLIHFPELETMSDKEWRYANSKLKSWITEDITKLEDKNQSAKYNMKQAFSFIIDSNDNPLKNADKDPRFCLIDCSIKYLEDYNFFNNLKNRCFNDEVGHCLYKFIVENIDISNFNPQRDFPMTQNKKDMIYKLLDSTYQFLKYEYLLKERNVDSSVQELYDEYKLYCADKFKIHDKIYFTNKLREINIDYYKTNGFNRYKVSLEIIKKISNKKEWIHKLDDDISLETRNEIKNNKLFNTEENENLKTQIEELQKQLKISNEENEKLKQENEKLKTKKNEYKNMYNSLIDETENKDDEIESLKNEIKSLEIEKSKAHFMFDDLYNKINNEAEIVDENDYNNVLIENENENENEKEDVKIITKKN